MDKEKGSEKLQKKNRMPEAGHKKSKSRTNPLNDHPEKGLWGCDAGFEKIFYNNPALMLITKEDGTIIDANNAYCSLTGYKRDDLTKQAARVTGILCPEDRKKVLKEIRKKGSAKHRKTRVITRDGNTADLVFSAAEIDIAGEDYILYTFLDTTEPVRAAEEELKKNKQLLENVLDVLPVGIFVADKEGNIAQTNAAARLIWGGASHLPIDQLHEYRGWHKGSGKKLNAEDWAFARAFTRGETSINEEIEIECFDGSRKTILNSAVPVYNEQKEIISAVAVIMDISRRISDEEKLRETNERLTAAIEAGELGTWDLDLTTNKIDRSSRHDQIWGYPDGIPEWDPEVFMKNVVPQDHAMLINAYELAMETGLLSHENRIKWPDGSIHWISANGRVRFDNNKTPVRITGVVADITERKKAEEAIRGKQIFYENFAEAMPPMAFIADTKGNIIYFNQRWYEYVGGMEGTEKWGWKDKDIHHPDDLQATIDRWTHSLQTGEPYEIEYRLRRHDGAYLWHLGRANPIRDKEGDIEFWVGTNTNIHKQKEAEESLKKAGELYEDLLYITAHDLRGPIANMHLALNTLDWINDEDKKYNIISSFRQLAGKMENTIQGLTDILQLQKVDGCAAEEINFEEILSDILSDDKETLKPGNEFIVTDFEKESIKYIKPFLYSIMQNLINNSVKYRRDDVPLKIEISSKKEREYTVLVIKDNGIGIDIEKHGRYIFSPFGRIGEKNVKGTGIGLYLVKNIIEKNQGDVKAESTPGEGTDFYCYLKEY